MKKLSPFRNTWYLILETEYQIWETGYPNRETGHHIWKTGYPIWETGNSIWEARYPIRETNSGNWKIGDVQFFRFLAIFGWNLKV